MKYRDYLLSAKRHSHACKILQEKIDITDNTPINDDDKNYLALNLYYLSGYIIECSLKFKIFESFGFEHDLDITKDTCSTKGINYNKKIKTHNFIKLLEYLQTKVPDISYSSDIEEINDLLSKWQPELRYIHATIDYEKVKQLYTHAKLFLRKI
ncbi:hypothetical protein HMPREF1310_02282 [Proteus mirabilis WGLW4]|uniref:hypothetical protein n=1 Tax=Proteus mirabilis TaxID=584 RepID=UPI00028332AC|nr:hypothetical protein [Proteus mirabilis]EKA97137.1 hypothetical protein HMPREF1310_02282 [Proteus mirabilis WGLW4]MBG2887948.1 hypothetical protein [Proteus mirabilis]